MTKIFQGVDNKDLKTYFFSHKNKGVKSSDISSLDVMSENVDESEWGGLSQFATKASDVVSKYMSEYLSEE